MKRKLVIIFTIILFITIAVGVIYPMYNSWRDRRIVIALESKVIPFVKQNQIKFFSNEEKCRQIQYGIVEAASPKGCAYVENRTDESKKAIADFTNTDEKLFDDFKKLLNEATSKEFISIGYEYPISYRPEHAALPQTPIGMAFYVHCLFCRTRYVYLPNYQKLPPDIEGEIFYVPLDKNWYRVDQDWN